MPKCASCKYFRTDNDCDGPEWEWCALERVEAGYYVGGYSACSSYDEAEDDGYDWDDD